MALNQYIGARYVPLIKGEWDSTITYEPLSVVLYQGASYTSICNVPIGIPPTNTAFWALTGNYNAQVELYRQEVARIKEELENRLIKVNTVADMITYDGALGDFIYVSGYHTIGDGGASIYAISDTNVGYSIELANGLFARWVEIESSTFEMFGAYGDNVHDDSEAIQKAFLYAGKIDAINIYRIKNTIQLNTSKNITPESGLKNTLIMGRGKNVSLANSDATVTSVNENEATFVFDGGTFALQGTSKVDFDRCVFIGSVGTTMMNTAFTLTDPARKLNISNSTFSNLKYGIYCNNNEKWSGESIFNNLYFMLCDTGIYYKKGGYDCLVSECIFQGSCNYAIVFNNSLGALISGNHDYSKMGCTFMYGANIVNNYFDGLGKLRIGCSYDKKTKTATHGTVICGNTFLTNFHNETYTGDIALVTIATEYFMSCSICNNKLNGGAENANIYVVDLTLVKYSGNNVVKGNTGAGIDAIFKGSTASNNGYYFNNYGGFYPTIEYTGVGDVKSNIVMCENGYMGFIRINDPRIGSDNINIINAPTGGIVNSVTWRTDNNDVTTMTTNSSYTESTTDGKKQVTLFFVNFGSTPITDTKFTL